MLFLHWKTQELPESLPSGPLPHKGLYPWIPPGSLSGLHATRLPHVVCFKFLQFAQALLNEWGPLFHHWGTQPSLAHGHPQAKIRHCDNPTVSDNTWRSWTIHAWISRMNSLVSYCTARLILVAWSKPNLIIGLIFPRRKKKRPTKILLNVLLHVYGFPFTKLPTRVSYKPY